MFTTRLRSLVAALFCTALVPLPDLPQAHSAPAEDPEYATVALLLPVDTCFQDSRCVVFDGPTTDTDDSLRIENNAYFGDFAGADLTPTDARYIARGGPRGVVRGVNAVAPDHGVMLLGRNSDVIVEFCGFVYVDGSALRYESVPENATGMLVIVSGQVR